MERILITGASGFLGQYVALHLKDRYHVCGLYYRHPVTLEGCELIPLDIRDQEDLRAAFRAWSPDVVVHAAAQSDLDQCEREPAEGERVNVWGTECVARAAAEHSARLIHISTDMVYDGSKGNYTEADAPGPLMRYGRTKLEAEERAVALCGEAVILRVALMYGWGRGARPTFSDWLVGRLQAGEEVPVFTDQYRSPLFVGQAAEAIAQLIQAPEVRGVFNCGGGERLSRYDFGRTFCDVFDFPPTLLRPIEMDTLTQAARRPRDCSLDSTRLSALLHIKPLTVREGLERMKQERAGGAPG